MDVLPVPVGRIDLGHDGHEERVEIPRSRFRHRSRHALSFVAREIIVVLLLFVAVYRPLLTQGGFSHSTYLLAIPLHAALLASYILARILP